MQIDVAADFLLKTRPRNQEKSSFSWQNTPQGARNPNNKIENNRLGTSYLLGLPLLAPSFIRNNRVCRLHGQEARRKKATTRKHHRYYVGLNVKPCFGCLVKKVTVFDGYCSGIRGRQRGR